MACIFMHVYEVSALQFAFDQIAAEKNSDRPLHAINAARVDMIYIDVWIATLTCANVLTSLKCAFSSIEAYIDGSVDLSYTSVEVSVEVSVS